jgi:hypothetical protein
MRLSGGGARKENGSGILHCSGELVMKGKQRKSLFTPFLMCFLLVASLVSTVSISLAHDHKDGWKHFETHMDRESEGLIGSIMGHGKDKGNETTGQIVAWSLAAANFTVALSLILKGARKFAPLGPEAQAGLSRFNSTQKKYLMRLHYILNPMILVLAILHWTLSRCESTAMPELGLLAMGSIVLLGIVLKFKLCPKEFLRNVYKVHTQPVLLLILISLLVFGHLSMD